MSEQEQDYDIEAIKLLFFDPKQGGSRELRSVVEDLVASYQKSLQYINKHMSAEEQRTIEHDEYWMSAEKLQAAVAGLLGVQHIHVAGAKEKFFTNAQALGLIEGVEAYDEELAEDYSSDFSYALAQHYAANVKLVQVMGRCGAVADRK